ncbi:Arm DNA-binding domain-containing protein [Klebsiella pasteurii]|uniref:Arm DNA-binding domain-containing protein n=2 Tax=Klebsiella/Raoultella group TaxID=2890311 RepID=UPI002E26CC25
MNGKPIPKRIELSDAKGLSVRVTPNGVIVFQYRYKIDGRPRRMTIGQYDQVSLKEAREQVSEFRKLVAVGKDPIRTRPSARKMLPLFPELYTPALTGLPISWQSRAFW